MLQSSSNLNYLPSPFVSIIQEEDNDKWTMQQDKSLERIQ